MSNVTVLEVAAPKRDTVFAERLVPRAQVPAAVNDRADVVGQIRSLTIASKRYWFGYDDAEDDVLSPLIDDPQVMAQFASDRLLTPSGAKSPRDWSKAVESAGNAPVKAAEARDFTGREFHEALRALDDAQQAGVTAPALSLPTAVLDLVSTTNGTPVPAYCGALPLLRIAKLAEGNCTEGALLVVTGASPPPDGTDLDDAINILIDTLTSQRKATPENWRTLLLAE